MTTIDFLKARINSIFQLFDLSPTKHLILNDDIDQNELLNICIEEKMNYAIESPITVLDGDYSPKKFFKFLKENHQGVIYVTAHYSTKVLKSSVGLKILEGAVCSTPDENLWSVSYTGEKPFKFYGSLIMLVSPGSVNWNSTRYSYLKRDGLVIEDLKANTDQFNLVFKPTKP